MIKTHIGLFIFASGFWILRKKTSHVLFRDMFAKYKYKHDGTGTPHNGTTIIETSNFH